ncbi:hypothetical protein ACU4HD_47800 [Cupriavidus basilensis]
MQRLGRTPAAWRAVQTRTELFLRDFSARQLVSLFRIAADGFDQAGRNFPID